MKLRSSKIPRADHSSSGPFRALLASAVLGGGLLAGGPAPSDGSGARAAESSVTGFERRPAGPGLLAFGFSGDLAAVGWDEPRPGTDATARVLIARDGAHANAPVSEWIDAPLVTTWIAHPPGSRLRVEGSWGDTTPVPWPADLRPDVRESIRSDLARPLLVGEPNWLRDVWATPVRFVPLVPDGAGGLAYAEQATFVARLENPGDIVAAAS